MENLLPGLYLVATPLGNMGDISKRAILALENVDAIACEDTRELKKLLGLIGVEKRDRDIISIHEHNEYDKSTSILDRIAAGESIAYTSDAGMPAISDPGAILVDGALERNLMVTCVPGATAVTTALALSGFKQTGFSFLGFFPRSQKEKNVVLEHLTRATNTTIFYESPKRLGSTLEYLSKSLEPNNRVVVARELTKKHEEIFRGTFEQASKHFAGEVKGECVVLIEAIQAGETPNVDEVQIKKALALLKSTGSSSRDACEAISLLVDVPKNRLKDLYLEISG